MKKCVRELDRFAPDTYQKLHLDNSQYNKTVIGGCCSIFIYVAVVYVLITSVSEIL